MTFVQTFVFVDVFLSLLLLTLCKSDYVPILIWSSSEFDNRKNAEDLVLNKIKSDLFESYILEVIGNTSPVISVFLEEHLGSDDFEWKDETNFKSFPYLSNLSLNSRVDYFRGVENPSEVFAKLSKHISKISENEENFEDLESDILMVEFKKIDSQRPKVLRSHDAIIEKINRHIDDSGRDWICVYTGKHSTPKEVVSEIKEMSSWHVDHHFFETPSRILSVYEDRFTKLALVTKGSIQLLLPSPKNLAYKNLEEFNKITVFKKETTTEFVIWFTNYTLTLHLDKVDSEWIVKSGKIVNEKGDSLMLYGRSNSLGAKERITEFQSQGKPFVKLKLNKYKILRIQYFKEPCDNSFKFQVTAVCTALILASGLFLWYSVTKNLDFSVKSKIVKIPFESIVSSKFEDQ